MRAFIVRPFGAKEGVDFDRVEAELIQPALRKLTEHGIPITGVTTGAISYQGNIRKDMFRMLVASDVVIADVSIHNANVFYELGIRHGLRPRRAFLMRSRVDKHDYPFDLQTDRYFLYDAAAPGGQVDALAQALRSTIENGPERDSPVFELLQELMPHGRGELVKLPPRYREDVDRARHGGQAGDLRLLAYEAGGAEWEPEALQLAGDALLKVGDLAGARDTFERLRAFDSDHIHANWKLGTVYQRLSLGQPQGRRTELLQRSEQAIQRLLDNREAGHATKVEAWCLYGSNWKNRWRAEFTGHQGEARQRKALSSPHFAKMIEAYLHATRLDLDAHYPLVNAYALLKVQLALAERYPDVWQQLHDDADDAAASLRQRKTLVERLNGLLPLAVEIDPLLGTKGKDLDPWVRASRADYFLFSGPAQEARIRSAYETATQGCDRFALEACRRTLAIYGELGLFEPGIQTALAVIDDALARTGAAQVAPARVLLFTGHMLDTPSRPPDQARFPATPAAEAEARRLIEAAVRQECAAGSEQQALGISGAACGADILFLEVCASLGIRTEIFLALPPDQFEVTSVQHGGVQWVNRYRQQLQAHEDYRVLQEGKLLPPYLEHRKDYDIWQRNNFWMMFHALAAGAPDKTLIALYNPDRDASGPGGTGHLVQEAGSRGFKKVEVDARGLVGG